MPAQITLKPSALEDLDADARRLLVAAADLGNAAEQLLGMVPPEVNPVVIVRQHLAELQAARDAFLDAAGDVLEVREVEHPRAEAPPADDVEGEEGLVERVADRSPAGALSRAGYEGGDLDRALVEQAMDPGAQARR